MNPKTRAEWKRKLEENPPRVIIKHKKTTPEQVSEILRLRKLGLFYDTIAFFVGVEKGTVAGICQRAKD